MGSAKRALDVGCGTGELACDLGKMGIPSVGIDFAEDMIALCKQKSDQENTPNVEFVTASVFDYDPGEEKFDLIAANGFIEYISLEQLHQFLDTSRKLMNANGSLVVGSRNRLFNIASLNAFTEMELEAHAMEDVIRESIIIQQALSMDTLITALQDLPRHLPQYTSHPETNIGVSVRHQYTPAELVQRFAEHGFKTMNLIPVHCHAVPPAVKKTHPELHTQMAHVLQSFAWDVPQLIPNASTFMVQATLA